MKIDAESFCATGAVLSVSGRIDTTTAGDFERRLCETLDGGMACLVLDLHGVEYMSSAGLRALLVALKKARKHEHGDILLAAMNPQVRQVLETSCMDNLFKLFATRAEALDACV